VLGNVGAQRGLVGEFDVGLVGHDQGVPEQFGAQPQDVPGAQQRAGAEISYMPNVGVLMTMASLPALQKLRTSRSIASSAPRVMRSCWRLTR
jgi:hypothetical protein